MARVPIAGRPGRHRLDSAATAHGSLPLAEPESLVPALDGADALFLLTSGDFVSAGGSVSDVLDVARAGGIGRIVLLSSQGVATGSHPSTLEDPVTESDLEWTLLRPGGFDSNTLQWAEMVRAQRMVGAPFADVALPTIDPADIAEVAAVALRDAGHAGRAYELTGPAPISPRQQAMAIADALGEPRRRAGPRPPAPHLRPVGCAQRLSLQIGGRAGRRVHGRRFGRSSQRWVVHD
jgi:uncharacterized protein YbjT (DUF2867 family)